MAVIDFRSVSVDKSDDTGSDWGRTVRQISFAMLISCVLGLTMIAPETAQEFLNFIQK